MNFLVLQNLTSHNCQKKQSATFYSDQRAKSRNQHKEQIVKLCKQEFCWLFTSSKHRYLVLQNCLTTKTKLFMYRNISTSEIKAATHQSHGYSRLLEGTCEIRDFERQLTKF